MANYTGIGCLRSTPASSCCSATSCTFLRPFSPPFVVQTGGVVLEECPSTLSTAAYFWCPVLIRCRPPRFAVHCRGGWASTGPDRTVGEPEERARAASAGPRASSRGRPPSHGGKGLLAGDAALRPAHCPTFLPVTSRKCFGMLSTAQNRCGVFAGIGTMLTGRHKTAIVLQPAVRGR